ncbi:Cd(II)/Pb(II)-responsive transcriptional regulator [Pandoraea anhela]|uniref:Cd(II)/Pb(II)-responsive transcriptional regulator n=1 Tax=Pandoraea anhela TaxID=2508295 RepID=A0A5E4W8Q5_9BURK|nr:Cd(II)/Pb(II)-responsive transcriptional regulator [Pandoraea anhela]VVE21018.1 Cd(II)/Pb(II)-responsive transcriptional regulator [Pandoraea anhela]
MKIGELAKAARCTTETVRFYENQGLLPLPERNESNYRRYTRAHLERLRFIRNCRSLDMTHDEIRALLEAVDGTGRACGAIGELLLEHIEHVEVRLTELTRLKEQLQAIYARCGSEGDGEVCAILRGLTDMDGASEPKGKTHLR